VLQTVFTLITQHKDDVQQDLCSEEFKNTILLVANIGANVRHKITKE